MNNLVEAHRAAVLQYLEISVFAASAYLPDGRMLPLTEDQRAAYLTLPYLIDECRSAWDAIAADETGKPQHYLLTN